MPIIVGRYSIQLGLLTQPAVDEAGSLAELHLRVYWHRWGVYEIQNMAEFSQLRLVWGLDPS